MTEPLDDIDCLFTRLDRAPLPDGFTAQVLARTSAAPRRPLVWPWLLAGLAAMALLGVAGYLAGQSLASSDGLELLEAILGDTSLLISAPGDALAAIGEVIPWRIVGL